MNDLLESKKILEGKIELSKFLMEEKFSQFKEKMKEANELQLVVENLRIEINQDQEALAAVNEQLEIPTLALQKKNPLWKELKTEKIAS